MTNRIAPRSYLDSFLNDKEVLSFSKMLISIGSLAPSTHNTQPWVVREHKNSIKIIPDLTKCIPAADPDNRHLFISVGAFCGNIVYFLESAGSKPNIDISNNTGKVTITYEEGACDITSENSLKALKTILSRQNYRGFYKESTVSQRESLAKILKKEASLSFVDDSSSIDKLARQTAIGVEQAYKKEEFRHEIADLINANWSKKRYGLHGYSLRMKNIQSLVIPFIMRRKDIGSKLSKLNYESFRLADAVCLYTLPKKYENFKGLIETGIKMESLMLRLAVQGWSCSIYVASLETKSTKSAVSDCFNLGKELPQIPFTVGIAPDALPYSSRKYLDEIIQS